MESENVNIHNSMELMKKYSRCPKCGSEEIGNGNGGVIVENNTFRRFCKCGYDVSLNGEGQKVDTIKMNIEFSIEDLRKLRDFLAAQQHEDIFEVIYKYDLELLPDDIDSVLCSLYHRINEAL